MLKFLLTLCLKSREDALKSRSDSDQLIQTLPRLFQPLPDAFKIIKTVLRFINSLRTRKDIFELIQNASKLLFMD